LFSPCYCAVKTIFPIRAHICNPWSRITFRFHHRRAQPGSAVARAEAGTPI
jgi:hypothetical protein